MLRTETCRTDFRKFDGWKIVATQGTPWNPFFLPSGMYNAAFTPPARSLDHCFSS